MAVDVLRGESAVDTAVEMVGVVQKGSEAGAMETEEGVGLADWAEARRGEEAVTQVVAMAAVAENQRRRSPLS